MRITKSPGSATFFAALLAASSIVLSTRAESASYEEDLAQALANKKQSIIDRKLFVSPAPKKFKPIAKGPKLELRLTVESKKIRRGTPIRYRFEIVSVGSEPVLFGESTQSFFKTGRLPSDRITMRIKNPKGIVEAARSRFASRSDVVTSEIQLPAGLTEAERAEKIKSMKISSESAGTLIQTLAPGETLHSIGDTHADNLRILNIDAGFKQDGIYELYVVLDAFSKSENTSNHVRVEIEP